MIFNPEESVDLTGLPQRTFNILTQDKIYFEKEKADPNPNYRSTNLLAKERELIILLEQFPTILEQAAEEHNPSVIAIYIFQRCKELQHLLCRTFRHKR
jgi:arginyl-tRNA synthetase